MRNTVVHCPEIAMLLNYRKQRVTYKLQQSRKMTDWRSINATSTAARCSQCAVCKAAVANLLATTLQLSYIERASFVSSFIVFSLWFVVICGVDIVTWSRSQGRIQRWYPGCPDTPPLCLGALFGL